MTAEELKEKVDEMTEKEKWKEVDRLLNMLSSEQKYLLNEENNDELELRKFVAELILKERVYTDKSIVNAISDMDRLMFWLKNGEILENK